MSIIYVLIPIAIIFIIIAIAVFFWAVRSEQFTDLDKQAHSILFDDSDTKNKSKKVNKTQNNDHPL